MGMKITNKDLEKLVERLNELTGSPKEPYSEVDGKMKPNALCFHLSGAYGGVTLHRMSDVEGCTGITTPLSCGYVTKKELYYLILNYIKGIELGIKLK